MEEKTKWISVMMAISIVVAVLVTCAGAASEGLLTQTSSTSDNESMYE
jgi:hypothetical protein